MNELYDLRHEKRTFLKMMVPTSNHSLLGPCFSGHHLEVIGGEVGRSLVDRILSLIGPQLGSQHQERQGRKTDAHIFFSGIF